MNSLYTSRRSWLAMLAMLPASQLPAHAETGRQRVLTALPPLHALASALVEGTAIDAVRVPLDAAVPMEGQTHALLRLQTTVFQQAVAVITLTSLWRADPLYAAARRHNLRIVEIDASRSWDAAKPGVAVIRAPLNDVPWSGAQSAESNPSPYVWLGPINAMRMAALIAADLARLSPPDAPRIARNLAKFEGRLRRLKARYGARMAELPDPRVLSLASEFVYLFDEFGLYVDGWFVQQDIDWSDADSTALTRHLRERGIRVVIHKWTPDDRIVQAIEAGGARLLILDAGNPGVLADAALGYEALVSWNLDALLAAFAAAGDDGTPRR